MKSILFVLTAFLLISACSPKKPAGEGITTIDLTGKPFIAKLPEHRRQLEDFIAGLSDEDNQILTVVTLKK